MKTSFRDRCSTRKRTKKMCKRRLKKRLVRESKRMVFKKVLLRRK